jgi:hypothetical protein
MINRGSITSTSSPVIFVIGHVRDPAIQYIVDGGALSDRSSFFFTQHSTAADAVSQFGRHNVLLISPIDYAAQLLHERLPHRSFDRQLSR